MTADNDDVVSYAQGLLDGISPEVWEVGVEIDGVRSGQSTVVLSTSSGVTKRVVTVDQTRSHWDGRQDAEGLTLAERNIAFIAASPKLVADLIALVRQQRDDYARAVEDWAENDSCVLADSQRLAEENASLTKFKDRVDTSDPTVRVETSTENGEKSLPKDKHGNEIAMCKRSGCVLAADHPKGQHRTRRVSMLACPHNVPNFGPPCSVCDRS